MHRALVGTTFFACFLVACGGIAIFTPEGQGGGGGADGWDDDGTDDGVVTTTESTGTGPGLPAIAANIEEVKLGANCMPVVGPDPLQGSVTVRYENVGTAPGNLEIVRASVVFANSVEGWVFTLAVAPTSSGTIEPGASVVVEHAKLPSEEDSAFLCQLCGQQGSVELRIDDPTGGERTIAASFELGCAF